ncbi:MAG: GTP-binding protein [Nanoarchaeota archaeon]|nr:GTP-binding protein [Nanoarchaeota archaeon]
MSSIDDEIAEIEKEIAKTQKNKATEHHLGNLYGKIAKLKEKADKQGGRGKGAGYTIKKAGDATVALVGFPSVGKSTLINSITNASSEVAAYEFTTLTAIPGMMNYKDASIQIVDLPGIISEASKGKGRGREVLNVVRNADLVIMLIDVKKLHHIPVIEKELYEAGVRLDKKPPKVFFKSAPKGGIKVMSTFDLTELSPEIISSIMRSYGFINGEVIIRENISAEDFIDALLGNRHYVPSLMVFNKVDTLSDKELKKLKKTYKDAVFISAEKGKGLDNLKEEIFQKTRIIRVYLKPKGKPADMDKPVILHKGDRIYDLCLKIHKQFIEYFRYAQVWGKSAKFPAQQLGLNHVLEDKDVVTIVI